MKLPSWSRTGRNGGDPASDVAQDVLALGLVGDGVVSVLWPRRRLMSRKFGPRPYQRLTQAAADRPQLIRSIAAAELAAGLWWTHRLYRAHAA